MAKLSHSLIYPGDHSFEVSSTRTNTIDCQDKCTLLYFLSGESGERESSIWARLPDRLTGQCSLHICLPSAGDIYRVTWWVGIHPTNSLTCPTRQSD